MDLASSKRSRKLGITAHLTKPIDEEELLTTILDALSPASSSSRRPREASRIELAQQSLKILLIEDNKVNRQLGQRMLQKRGHKVVLAFDGRQAVEACQREAFDLLLMDVEMPELNGLDATHLIRNEKSSTNCDVPIIGLTANAMPGDREACLDAGMNSYLTKPLDMQQLFRTIESLVSTARV
jgi:two-component system, sensor histidine kinase and response regulator